MGDFLLPDEPALSHAVVRRIDEACDRFEAAWRSGEDPRIEEHLGDFAGAERQFLLRQLLFLELDYRSRRGQVPLPSQYQPRFPDESGLIEAVFAAHETGHSPQDTVDRGKAKAGESTGSGRAGPSGPPPGGALAPERDFGRYVLKEQIGAGGMGHVFRAVHRGMERQVAIKLLSPQAFASHDAARRFQQEAKLLARLNHPGVVAVYDAGEQDGEPYLVMEHIDGQDLEARVRRQGPLPVAQAVEYMLQAARAMQYAHAQGVIHRDLKPGNLLVNKEGKVKILDLGLARPAPLAVAGDEESVPRLTTSGQIMGTFAYMAPEQAEEPQNADCRADVYSLGCTLHYLLTGKTPYGGETTLKQLLAHREGPVPSLRAARPDVPEGLDAVFRKMVAKRPEDRYASMAEVIAALEACRGAAALRSRRRRLRIAIAGAAAVAVIAGVVAWRIYDSSRGPPDSQLLEERWTSDDPESLRQIVSDVAYREEVLFQVAQSARNAESLTQIIGPEKTSDGRAYKIEIRKGEFQLTRMSERLYEYEDLHEFIERTVTSRNARRNLYGDVAAAMQANCSGTWAVGDGLTKDNKAYEFRTELGKWFARALTAAQVEKMQLRPKSVQREVDKDFKLLERRLVTLQAPQLQVERAADGGQVLAGRVRYTGKLPKEIEDLCLVVVFPGEEDVATVDAYQYFKSNELPAGAIEVERSLPPKASAVHGARFYLRAFVPTYPACGYRISNELVWVPGAAGQEGAGGGKTGSGKPGRKT